MFSRASVRRRIVYDTRSPTFFNVVGNVEDCTSRRFEARSPRYRIVTDRRIFGSDISRNSYGNAVIDRYGGCFEEDVFAYV